MTEEEYWEKIEQYFVTKRGNALILSPRDWPLITSWQEREIPLEVIFEGIDTAFARLEEKQTTSLRRTIPTLTFCQRDIENAWESWKKRHPEFAVQQKHELLASERRKLATKFRSVSRQLQQYAESPLYQCIHADLRTASETLTSLIPLIEQTKEQTPLDALKARTREVEQQLATRLEQALDAETRQHLYAKAEARLISHKHKMNSTVYQETLRLAFIQELRNVYPLPSFL